MIKTISLNKKYNEGEPHRMRILGLERLFKVKTSTCTLYFVFILRVNGKKFFKFFVVQKFLINHLSIMTSTYFLTTGTLCNPKYLTSV